MIRFGKKKVSIPLILAMYLLIYNPPAFAPLLKFNCVWLVMLPSAAYVLLNRKALKEFVNVRAVVWAEGVLCALLVYLLVMAKINGNSLTQFAFYVYWIAGDIPFALACWIYLRKNGLGFPELLDHLLITGLVMAATAIGALLIPALKEFFVEKMVAYGIPYTIKLSCYRHFGFAANLSSTASYAQVLLACIALYRSIRGKWSWLPAFPVLAFSANINTRTAIYLMLAGMAAVFAGALFTRDGKTILKFFAVAVPAVAIAYFGLSLIRYINPLTHEWLEKGIEQVSSFTAGEEATFEESYFGELAWMLAPDKFPRGLRLLFGAGTEVMGTVVEAKYGVSSDVGFVSDIWRGGLLYLAVMIGLYLRTLWRMMRSKAIRLPDGVFLALLFLAFFGLTNIKGHFFIHSDITVIFILLVAALVWGKEKAPAEGE